jgi:hypothetical protein
VDAPRGGRPHHGAPRRAAPYRRRLGPRGGTGGPRARADRAPRGVGGSLVRPTAFRRDAPSDARGARRKP